MNWATLSLLWFPVVLETKPTQSCTLNKCSKNGTAPTLTLYFTVHKVSLNSWVGLEFVILLPRPLEKLRLSGLS